MNFKICRGLFMLFLAVLTSFQLFAVPMGTAKIFSYPLPSIYKASSFFELQVNGTGIPVVGYNDKYDYAQLSMSKGKAEFTISLKNGDQVSAYHISPKKLAVAGIPHGHTLSFTLYKDEYLIIKINRFRELVIVADAAEGNKPAASGKGIFNITGKPYLAVSSATELATEAVQKAIDDAAAYKGGKGIVYVPAGVYPVRNLKLKSNMSLYLEGGAVLLFSGQEKDFKISARKASQNRNITWWIATDSGAHDIRIYGRGTLDGNGKYATEKNNLGAHILAIMHTDRFELNGPVIRESGAWAIIPTRSKNLVFQNFKLFNRFDMGENDGIDVIESQNVLVKHAIGIALDDPFSTKTWMQNTDLCRNWPGKPMVQDGVVFDDCISWTYCYGYKIGQGVMQDQRNIVFKDCVVYDAAVGIGIHHKWGTASVKNVLFDGIDIERLSYQNDDHRTWAIFLMQNGDKKGSGPIDNVLVKNVLVRDQGKSPGKIKGISAATPISNLRFKNIVMPGTTGAASTLQQINMTDTSYTRQIEIKK
ncbi:coagulation factor 5/8 type domain-containing protein [Pedobacter sp. KBW06]|uniref:glycoside hydrolase family 28 protein n=1 Tax=Pedobacter sp. KBW06 TaxID=2153359 RepID=UPI000F599814|nr:glycosyl hydrolase family 28 protein [Pedobacter sp. KBW06]RQO74373.1 coagulation factor 5/8 type domain-containing protein [Pedobacter sp. KBW06]